MNRERKLKRKDRNTKRIKSLSHTIVAMPDSRLSSMQNKYKSYLLMGFFVLLRLAIACLAHIGYLHPDEFFQGPEVIAGSEFKSQVNYAWEFNTDKPIRCMLLPQIINTLAFKLIKLFYSNPSAYLLLVAPRIIYTLLSFINDICLYKLCKYYSASGKSYIPVCLIFQSSFACLGLLTRSMSNSTETIILAIFLVVISKSLVKRYKIVFKTPGRSTPVEPEPEPYKQLTISKFLGILLALGVFNRPTFICFAAIPLIFWLREIYKTNHHDVKRTLTLTILPFSTSCGLAALAIILYDTIYYRGYESVKDTFSLLTENEYSRFLNRLISSIVITPYNFVAFNTKTENLANFGIHFPLTHIAVNVPLLFSSIGLCYYEKILSIVRTSSITKMLNTTAHRVYAMMIFIILTSTIALSFIPHQEFRFIVPLILPLSYSFGHKVYASRFRLITWLVINFSLLFFYSFIHQSGCIRAILNLDTILEGKESLVMNSRSDRNIIRVVAFGSYPIPSYLLNINRNQTGYELDTFSRSTSNLDLNLEQEIQLIFNRKEEIYKTYIIMPSVYKQKLYEKLGALLSKKVKMVIEGQYNYNFNFEHLSESIVYFKSNPNLKTFKEAFGHTLISLSPR